MRVLLVEDEKRVAAAITSAFDDIDFLIATTRDEAFSLIESDCFDVAVCDLKVPPSDGAPSDVEHGLAVLTNIRGRSPGTPIIAFTAYKTKEVLELLFRAQRQEDFLGTGHESPLLRAIDKDQLPELLSELRDFRAEVARLEDIDVVPGPGQTTPDWTTCRVVHVYARQRECVLSRVSPLTGGHSGVPVIRVEMEKADGSSGGSAVSAHCLHCSGRGGADSLPTTCVRRLASWLLRRDHRRRESWRGRHGGVFYQVAEDAQPLWQLPTHNDARAAAAVNELRAVHDRWTQGAPAATVELREIRRGLVDDERWFEAACRCGLTRIEVHALENVRVHIRRSTAHADLHGGNVLVGTNTVLIDFESVRPAPTPLDAVSLELSMLFHPEAPLWPGDWPTLSQLEQWADIEAYVAACPFPLFVRSCRAWATATARATRDILACAYAYIASQARFSTSREDRLVALMKGIRECL